MRRPKSVIVCLALVATSAAAQDVSPQGDARGLAKELVDVLGVTKIAGQRINDAIPKIRAAIKRANPAIADEALGELRRVGTEEVTSALPELADAAAIGRKASEKMPEVDRQAVAFGAVWGRQVGERIGNRIEATALKKGYVI